MGISDSRQINMSAKHFVDTAIHDKCVVVFSKSWCPYCKMAKTALDDVGAKYEVVELDKRGDGDAIQDYLKSITGAKTVPRVFIKGKCIGGGSETRDLKESGELENMLRECNALK
ncbi:glutaredoxin-like [Anneissia japonica]|uniref:glutaredoxin-like n=1 Tax=Anneissia japonica TaxID=1529436 RepID=UPI001425AF61|nr:glutaredoxin-like [Anneissia japonica]